jgi:autophagy-related protein 9
MAPGLLSRFLPTNNMAPSIYEDLRGRDGMSDQEDVEERAAMAVDEENLGGHYQDYDLDQADLFDGTDSQITTESTAFLTQQQARRPSNKSTSRGRKTKESPKSKWLSRSPRLLQDDGDDDVPASLLIEEEMEAGPSHPPHEIPSKRSRKQPPTSDHHTRDVQAQWEKTKARQRLHPEENARKPVKTTPRSGIFTGTPQEQAMWFWINVTNLDNFMRDVYHYYTGHGIWCICLDRSLSLLYVLTWLSQ